ncbi:MULTISPECIES: hypothetical protein [Micromonospora]|uniref:Uncharacterized protein n=1 Tax=Micromonospora yangpuensis TaxID=683228 RepID=A0A1C6TZB2_9ACTN|nr:hypothetical protein [Micromonospora yangpuensis]GGM21145.1 hypothetical protein GCM10012279_44420 [Micromonospora yangpuensis]SCL47145.1 hypothetical protein GA0070617_0490 [Micromonospora yangpuensis]
MQIPQPAWLRPYDPADSPGPIPSVVERFRRRGRDEPEPPSEAEREAGRYTVVLVSPEGAQALGDDRGEAGLQLFCDEDWDGCPAHLDDAVKLIEEACGEPVVLTEHHSDLTYWTASLRPTELAGR